MVFSSLLFLFWFIPVFFALYYLVGAKAPAPYLFENQTYGAGSVFDNARSAVAAAGKTFCPALPCDDVDTPEDLRSLRLTPDSHTHRCLAKIGVI